MAHPYLAGMTRRSHLERLDMFAIIQSLIPHELKRRIDRLAPRHVAIPSGQTSPSTMTGR
jgi:ATP-dependent helicase HrpB